ncbi:hypothetical protein AB432_018410 [Brevibacillus brevis]|uniref:Uncharacterized protein n=1 Tax=Brevibacillus brevis TaxID=1393 RepID=A0A2Z4MK27_BREBE|nr:hypothetical protein [Brevibacillus brevis]AWX56897.1 hypothetical protein AB432_018410 [Brevibacillus brevis]
MTMVSLPKHFIRVAASNEMSSAAYALQNAEALMVSQPYALKMRNSLGSTIEANGKPFLIDPETYRYFFPRKYHLKQKKPRAWLHEMAQLMPDEIKTTFGIKKAEPSNFDALQLIDFCKANIEIQTSLKKSDGTSLLPLAILCPYMLIGEENFSGSIQFHLQIIKTMLKVNKTGLPVIAYLYLSNELLNRPSRLEKIADALKEVECKAVAVWIDNFDETAANDDELENLKEFYLQLSASKHVLSMYGGTAQIMMMYHGLGSITHGVHYQLHKNGKNEGGGPAHYFYISNLRHRIRTIEASTIIERQGFSRPEYLNKVCNCPVCEKEISYAPGAAILSLEGNSGDQVGKLTTHFSYCKKVEIDNVARLTMGEYAEWLNVMTDHLQLTLDEEDYVDTVNNWISVIFGIDLEEQADDEAI